MKRLCALILAMLLMVMLVPAAFAETPASPAKEPAVLVERDEIAASGSPEAETQADKPVEYRIGNILIEQDAEAARSEAEADPSDDPNMPQDVESNGLYRDFADAAEVPASEPDVEEEEQASAPRRLLETVTGEETRLPEDENVLDVPKYDEKDGDGSRASYVADQVEITNRTVAVLTGEGLGIAYRIPSGGIYVLTQDYLQQADTYALIYNNPLGAAANFIQNGMHLNIYEPSTGVDIYLEIFPSAVSSMFPDASRLTNSEIETVMMYFLRNGFDVADRAVFGSAGANQYFFFDCTGYDNMVYMYTMVGGYTVRIMYGATDSFMISRGLQLLDGLTIVAV